MELKIHDPAPPFSLPATTGQKISLKQFLGSKVVLYFYPKDDTPGCTKEACQFRDGIADIKKAGAVILGVSPEDVASHEKFLKKFSLPFPLLADVNHAVAEKYGVWVEKSMYGRKYMGIERSTFLIDSQGRIGRIFSKVKVSDHYAEVLAALAEIK